MTFEDIIKGIKSGAEQKAQGILDNANSEAGALLKAAKDDAASYVAEAARRGEEESKQIMAMALSKAEIEGRNQYQSAINGMIENAKSGIVSSIGDFVASDTYKKLFLKLLGTAQEQLGKDAVFEVQKRDLAMAKKAKVAAIEAKGSFSGGFIADSKDGRMELRYTVEDILARSGGRLAFNILKRIKR